jgi:DNA-binding LytR/AlgR family response regulator
MNFLNAILFAEEKAKAIELFDEFRSIARGLNILGGYSDLGEFHKNLIDERDAIIFIDIESGCKNISAYLATLNLKKRKFICIIPESGEYKVELKKLNIDFIQRPITNFELQIIIKKHSKIAKIIDLTDEINIPVIVAIVSEIAAIIPTGKRLLFLLEKGKKHYDLNTIMRFIIENGKVYMVRTNGELILVKELLSALAKRLKEHHFELSDRYVLLNFHHVDSLSKNDEHAVMSDGIFKLGRGTNKINFIIKYEIYYGKKDTE